jgi:hypothetical protein
LFHSAYFKKSNAVQLNEAAQVSPAALSFWHCVRLVFGIPTAAPIPVTPPLITPFVKSAAALPMLCPTPAAPDFFTHHTAPNINAPAAKYIGFIPANDFMFMLAIVR